MPIKPIPGEIRAVWGPFAKGVKTQVVVQTVDGQKHNRTISVRAEADAWAAELRARIHKPTALVSAVPAWDGTAKWFADRMAAALRAMLECADPLQREILRKEVDSTAKACAAAPKLIDNTTLERRIAALEAQDKAEVAKRKHGPRAGKQNRPTREPLRPGTQIC